MGEHQRFSGGFIFTRTHVCLVSRAIRFLLISCGNPRENGVLFGAPPVAHTGRFHDLHMAVGQS